jgi:hypothetical protein
MDGPQEPKGRNIEALGLCLAKDTCRENGHIIGHSNLPRSAGEPPSSTDICMTCTEESGRLEGLRLWHSVCPCCFSSAFPEGLPTLEGTHGASSHHH